MRYTWAILAALAIALSFAPGTGSADDSKPLVSDRHDEFTDPALAPPEWPAHLPQPLHERQPMYTFQIVFENVAGGCIDVLGFPDSEGAITVGHVISPVTATNPRGFTAAGWAEAGTVCASAVNAIHVKTDHDYTTGRGTIFSILPIEQAKVDPRNYKSYLSHETSLQTDIPAGTDIFGGRWTPLVGSLALYFLPEGGIGQTPAMLPDGTQSRGMIAGPDWKPEEGQEISIIWQRRQYNPEYIEFENSFGGLILIKELGEEPYPIGQVLKPVVGIGRFLGTQYADTGRIRAAHPGVICISTSPMGTIGGFQIIPRDHAMSREMIYTRYKTQWMVVGPLWALDPSWEGTPPLFSDYLYPAYIPAVVDGEPNDALTPMEIYLGRFTVRGRYADSDDPDEYRLLEEAVYLDHYALKYLTHIRIYFPRV